VNICGVCDIYIYIYIYDVCLDGMEKTKKIVFPGLSSVMTKTLGKSAQFAECQSHDTRQTGQVCLVPWTRTLGKVVRFVECQDYGTRQTCR
jgi:hypothetical protein